MAQKAKRDRLAVIAGANRAEVALDLGDTQSAAAFAQWALKATIFGRMIARAYPNGGGPHKVMESLQNLWRHTANPRLLPLPHPLRPRRKGPCQSAHRPRPVPCACQG